MYLYIYIFFYDLFFKWSAEGVAPGALKHKLSWLGGAWPTRSGKPSYQEKADQILL